MECRPADLSSMESKVDHFYMGPAAPSLAIFAEWNSHKAVILSACDFFDLFVFSA